VLAVLDWELCTLGDPLADLGFLGLWWRDLEGFLPFDRLVERYADRTGLDVSRLGYYVGFAAFRLAVIGEGVYRRYLEGVMGEETVDLDAMRDGVADRAEVALRALEGAA
jgi:aminoglycoside phosphotransferase (APT) family kinase protein